MANILEDWSGDWRCEAALTKANVGLVHCAHCARDPGGDVQLLTLANENYVLNNLTN